MQDQLDKIICEGIEVKTVIGIYPEERHIFQNLILDLEADVERISTEAFDDPKAIRLDYAVVTDLIKKSVSQKKFFLIESIGEYVAQLVLEYPGVKKVKVKVLKQPKDLAPMKVYFECIRDKR